MVHRTAGGRKRNAPKGIPINHHGRVIGYYYPPRRLHSRRWNPSKHMVKKYHGIGYDAAVLDELEARGCEVLENVSTATGHRLRCSFATIRESGICDDLGFGPQVFLPLRIWSAYDANGQRIDQAPKEEPEPAPANVQMGLFAEVPA